MQKTESPENAIFNETLLDVIWQVVGRNLAFKAIVKIETLEWFKRYFSILLLHFYLTYFVFYFGSSFDLYGFDVMCPFL